MADANEDGLGDEKNALPGGSPVFVSAAVNASGGAGTNGTVRIHIAWDVSNVGTDDDVTSAQVTLNTHRGTNDSLDTELSAGILFGNGTLEVSDFETPLQSFPPEGAGTAATMPVPSLTAMPLGSDGTFTFDVTAQLKEALKTGFDFFTIQGRVANEFLLAQGTTSARGLEVRSSATSNLTAGLEPQLTVDTSFSAPVYAITDLSNGTLTDSQGNVITAASSFPVALPDANVTYTATSAGLFDFEYSATDPTSGVVDTAMVFIDVTAFVDSCALEGRPVGCTPGQ